jgi:hypothetical protein
MTTNTTDDSEPATEVGPQIKAAFKSHPGIATHLAISMPPGVASTVTAATPGDLESRIKDRRAEIIAKLVELRPDTRLEATEERGKLKAKLSELAHIIKEGVVDGWANLGDVAKRKLDHWLAS